MKSKSFCDQVACQGNVVKVILAILTAREKIYCMKSI